MKGRPPGTEKNKNKNRPGSLRLTCDIDVDGGLSPGPVPVPAAVLARVLRLAASHRQHAAVLLLRAAAARLLPLHLVWGHAGRDGPGQLPATPGRLEVKCWSWSR